MDLQLVKVFADVGVAGLLLLVGFLVFKAQAAERTATEKQRAAERAAAEKQRAEERKDWQEWISAMYGDLRGVLVANTNAMQRNSEVLGSVAASRFSCPAAGAIDEHGEPFRRRRTNGRVEEAE